MPYLEGKKDNLTIVNALIELETPYIERDDPKIAIEEPSLVKMFP